MIGDGKLLTNAHCVEHDTQVFLLSLPFSFLFFSNFLSFFLHQVKVKRRGDDRKYVAKVRFFICTCF